MPNRVILPNEDFPIKPSDIDTRRRFLGAFNDELLDIAARVVVRFAQAMGFWPSFSQKQIEQFARRHRCRNFNLSYLCDNNGTFDADDWWPKKGDKVPSNMFVAVTEGGVMCVTDALILNCYKASPIPRLNPDNPKPTQ